MHDRKEEEQEEVTGDPSITQIKKNSNIQAWIDEVQEAPVNPPQLPKKRKIPQWKGIRCSLCSRDMTSIAPLLLYLFLLLLPQPLQLVQTSTVDLKMSSLMVPTYCVLLFLLEIHPTLLVAESGNHACRLLTDIHKKVCWKTSENLYLSKRGIVLLLFAIALVFFVRGREEERSNTGKRLDWGRDYQEICCFWLQCADGLWAHLQRVGQFDNILLTDRQSNQAYWIWSVFALV